MKILLIAIVTVLGAAALLALILGQAGKLRGQRPGEVGPGQGMLRPIQAGALNAVSSQSPDPSTRIAPLSFRGDPASAFARLERAIATVPGVRVVDSRQDFLYAEAETPFLQFVDDIEFLLDADKHEIHMRSASRLGRRDFGVNRARLERIRAAFARQD